MILQGLTIDTQRVSNVVSRAEALKAASGSGSGSKRGRGQQGAVTEAVLVDTLREHDHCRCEELGLVPGLPVAQLRDLGAGCCDTRFDQSKGYVCGRLDRLRRRYGL